MIKIWKNTATLDDYGEGLNFTNNKKRSKYCAAWQQTNTAYGISLIESHF